LNRQFEQWHECGDRAMSSPSVRHGFDHDVAVNDASGEPEPVDELLAAAYALDGPEANRSLYARWASTYETDFIAESGYRYHERVAAVFVEHCLPAVSADEAVADVGCGTGVVGQALVRHQRVIVDGLDISPEMLQQATRKVHDGEPVYRQLLEADLTQPLTIEPGSYAGLISVGTFTHGHLGPEVLDGLLAIVRQLDALIAALALGLTAIGFGGRRLRPAATAGLVLGAMAVAAFLLPYNAHFTGRGSRFPIMEYSDRHSAPGSNDYGFGANRGMGWGLDPRPGHDVIDGLINTNLNLTATQVELFGADEWAEEEAVTA
jgi:SAM-dependent methyltransferase